MKVASECTYVPVIFFFFNDTATTEIYTLSLHDALPIYLHPADARGAGVLLGHAQPRAHRIGVDQPRRRQRRSEEHTSELQSQSNLVCRLLLEKTKNADLQRVLNDKRTSENVNKSNHATT